MATYVDGEAPETDSDDEQYFNITYLKVVSRFGRNKFQK